MKRPSFQFYPSDWLRDTALRTCSTGARGLWIDMICFMHEGNPYGYLKVGNKVILAKDLARMVGEELSLVEGWLEELKEAGVYDIDYGAICSRRMIRDENLRKIRAEGGKLGGNPKLKDMKEDNLEVKQNETPSSSTSSSSSISKKKKPIKTLLPENFGISEAVKAWAEKNGHTQLEKHLESFINKCKANSYQYADWDAAFRNAISDNWAKVGQVHVSKTSEDKSWMFSNQGIEAKARELGVSDYGVANHFQLKEKILQVMAKKALQ